MCVYVFPCSTELETSVNIIFYHLPMSYNSTILSNGYINVSHDIFQFFIYGEEKEKQKLCQLNLRMLVFFEAYMLKVFLSLIVFQPIDV